MNKSNSIECNSLKTIEKLVLSKQTKFRLCEINGIENYFCQQINQRKSCNKKLNKYVLIISTTFDYIDKILIDLSATSIVGAPVGKASASLTLIFSLTTGIVKKLLNITRNKKKKHDKILLFTKSKLNSVELIALISLISVTLIFQSLIDLDISHQEFIRILKEKIKYEKMKENLRSENEEYKTMRLSSVKSKT